VILLLALACAAPDSGSPEASGAETADSQDSDSGEAPVLLSNPPEAEDLDDDPAVVHVLLTAAPATFTLDLPEAEGGPVDIEGYAYDGTIPGPTIRAHVGDTVEVDVENELSDDTTVHWHGLHVPFEMDGVPWMSDPIPPGDSRSYTFTVDRPGTFWYHPHFDSQSQVDAGLYGAFIVEDPDEPAADDELVMIFDDWDVQGEGTPSDGDPDHGVDGLPGRWTINGLVDPTLTLRGGQRVRARMIDVSNTGYLDLSWPDMRIIATDQGLGSALDEGPLVLAPGDRAEAEWLVGEDGFTLQDLGYSHQGGATGIATDLLPVTVEDPAPAPDPLGWAFSGEPPTEDDGDTDVVYVLSGDPETGEWYINGEQWPDVTIATLPYGSEATIEVRNVSPTNHPFHLHGMPFEVLSQDGVAPTSRRVEDTLDIPVYGTARLRVEADNVGDWMAHCHILPHADGGMMTVLRVDAADAPAPR